MSTLKVTNIQATGETVSRAVSGVAAAWVNFKGTSTVTIRESNNVSSITDDGTGKYDVVITSAMDNGNYKVTTDGIYLTGDSNGQAHVCQRRVNPTTTEFGIRGINPSTPAFVDAHTCNGAIHGDLA